MILLFLRYNTAVETGDSRFKGMISTQKDVEITKKSDICSHEFFIRKELIEDNLRYYKSIWKEKQP